MMITDLPNGTSVYSEGFDAVFYRGDGVTKYVWLPVNKTIDYVKPFRAYSTYVLEDNSSVITFDHAIDCGETVKIKLRNNNAK